MLPVSIKQFSDEFDKLPEEVKFYYGSKLIGDLISDLVQKYSLDLKTFYDLIFDVVNDYFDFSLIPSYFDRLGLAPTKHKSFMADVIGQLFYPVDVYLKNRDIKQELIKAGADPDDYVKYQADFYRLIESENDQIIGDELADYEQSIDKAKDSAGVLELFKNDLVEILKSDGGAAVRQLNGLIFFLLDNFKTFSHDINQALLANNLQITSHPLSLDGKSEPPTVANWLHLFIKSVGSDLPDNLALAGFLSKDKNIWDLNDLEKSLLEKLFKLYRNLVFYPDSLSDRPVNEWEIFPVVLDRDSGDVSQDVLSDDFQSDSNKDLHDFKKEKVTPPQNELAKQLSTLKDTMKNYSPDSLEYKALNQELDRLRKK